MKQPANVTNDKKFSIFHTGYLDVKDSICVSHLSYLVVLLFVFRVNFADLMPIKTLLMLENKQSSHSHNDAQSYCRTHHTDLAMIENEAENSAVKQLIPVGVDVWIGLYRVPWSWSDKSPSLFRRWVSSEPNNFGGIQNCICENTAHIWVDETCSATKAPLWSSPSRPSPVPP
uniref:C-type lectin domain-containing protein n=1 Tax=Xiphophorus maculatus TaxID=8083 RepID=A0A3B5QQ77_XIPMA